MPRKTFTAKRHPESGRWSVYDGEARLVDWIGVNFDRSTARKYAFLLSTGKLVRPARPGK